MHAEHLTTRLIQQPLRTETAQPGTIEAQHIATTWAHSTSAADTRVAEHQVTDPALRMRHLWRGPQSEELPCQLLCAAMLRQVRVAKPPPVVQACMGQQAAHQCCTSRVTVRMLRDTARTLRRGQHRARGQHHRAARSLRLPRTSLWSTIHSTHTWPRHAANHA